MAEKFNAAFWKWFGMSVAVDTSGSPLVMRHGSESDFRTFEKKFIREKDLDATFNGFWFTSSTFASPAWGSPKHTKEFYISLQNPAPYKDWSVASRRAKKDFLRFSALGARSGDDATRMALQDMGYDGVVFKLMPKIDLKALERGESSSFLDISGRNYELTNGRMSGFQLFREGRPLKFYEDIQSFMDQHELVVAVFEPFQIKSAVDNDGSWDADDPDTRSNPRQRK